MTSRIPTERREWMHFAGQASRLFMAGLDHAEIDGAIGSMLHLEEMLVIARRWIPEKARPSMFSILRLAVPHMKLIFDMSLKEAEIEKNRLRRKNPGKNLLPLMADRFPSVKRRIFRKHGPEFARSSIPIHCSVMALGLNEEDQGIFDEVLSKISSWCEECLASMPWRAREMFFDLLDADLEFLEKEARLKRSDA